MLLQSIFMTLYSLFVFGTGAQANDGTLAGKNFHDFQFKAIDGAAMPMAQFKGKVVLAVNTASKCGFTKQYKGLQALYEKYKDQGFVVLGVPSNDFMGQEPGSNEEIKHFCEMTFGITFPMTEKVSVKGKDADPFYQWAAAQKNGDSPGWNFHKFLIGKDGALLESFATRVEPDDADLAKAIEAGLSATP